MRCVSATLDRSSERKREMQNNNVTKESRSLLHRREIKIEVSSLSRTLLKIRYGNAIGATVYNKIDVTSPVRKFQNPIKKFFSSSASVPANALSANAAAHTADVVSIWGSFENRFWIPTTKTSSSFFQICSSSKRLVVFFAAAGVAVIDLLKVVVVDFERRQNALVRRETHAQNRTVRVGADHHEVRFIMPCLSSFGRKVMVS